MAGTLYVVATPIGNLEDMSPRAVRVLRDVALVAAEDTRRTGQLLQHFGLTTRTISFHEHSEKGKASALISRLAGGESVALVSDAGTPVVSDPGAFLIALAHEAGIRVEPVPGSNAVVAALSASGFGSEGFVFLGFPPTKGRERESWFARLRAASTVVPTAVFYEAPHRIEPTLAEVRRTVGDVRVCVARELTKAHEQLIVGHLSGITLDQVRGEFTVVVEFGDKTETSPTSGPADANQIALEFGDLTKTKGLTRRQAISSLSRTHRLAARDIFDLLEQAKKSGV